MNSCASVFGLVFLVLTDLGAIIGFATPYWIVRNIGGLVGTLGKLLGLVQNFGLWARCTESECVWVFQEGGSKVSDADWFIAVQGLMAVGLCVSLVALLIATIALCCQCQNCNYAGTVAGLLLTAFLAMGIAVTLFGIKASQEDEYSAEIDSKAVNSFGWSFWLTAASAAMALFTSFIYGCSSRS